MVDFSSFRAVMGAVSRLLDIPTPPTPLVPPPLVLASSSREGLSPSKMAANVIARQSDAGIQAGPLPSGEDNPAEIMERVRMEEIVKALTQDARIQVTINPGIALTAVGGNAGGPVTVAGQTILFGTGFGLIA